MSILKVDQLQSRFGTTITVPSDTALLAKGVVVGSQHWNDYTNVNTTSTSYVDAASFTYIKKFTNSSLYGFFDINTLREGSQEQSWCVEINGTIVSELRNKASSTTGWDTRNIAFNWAALNGSAAGSYTIKLRLKVVTYGYYNYSTSFGNGVSHFTIMEIAQ